ncbi:YkvA family protein [Chryseobacterium sp.]|uniref:YkvA family protein n=1 Tax=Chryseobacterium sp. TaxID=1871047 RepID=UPI0011C94B97|nr:DUF1232 domain-containing protein [Chryseobacterium sp.]TXF74835.1 DUF1232 domain-containing protein [Chryseobacterium sp.]
MQLLKKIKEKAKKLKTELVVLHLAYQHPETPWIPKALIVLIIGYALSPIDLIPDFIPIIGLLDDLILLPLGIYWTIQLIPKNIITESRIKAITYNWNNDKNLKAGFIIVLIWCVILCFTISKFI